jgi:hypothetical protein
MEKLLEMQVKAEEKSSRTYNQIYLQDSHEMFRPKMYIFWCEVIDLMLCDDSVINLLFVRFDTVKSALSVGLIFL